METASEEKPSEQQPNWLLRVTMYYRRKHEIKIMTEARYLELNLSKYDVVIDLVHREIRIRRPNGKVIRYRGKIPRLGPRRGLPAVLGMLRRPPRFLTPYEVSESGNAYSLRFPKNLIAAIACTRRTFGDTGRSPEFILTTNPLSLGWNPDKSFCLVERADGFKKEELR